MVVQSVLRCVQDLQQCGFKILRAVSDTPSNVAAFKILMNKYPGEEKLYFSLPNISCRTFVVFNFEHFVESIKNNLLSARKFIVFPAFDFKVHGIHLSVSRIYWPARYS